MPFQNSVVGGTTLVRPAIRSPNYVAGSAGWSINIDGSAEFNDATIRGTVHIGTGSNYVEIDPTPIPLITISTSNAGQITPANIGYGTLGGQSFFINGADFGQGADFILFEADTTNQIMEVGFWDSFLIDRQDGATKISMDTDVTITGVVNLVDYATKQSATWQTPSFAANWSSTGTLNGNSTFRGLQYRKDAEDNVWVLGAAVAAAGAGGTVFTLPSGFRPPTNMRCLVPAWIFDSSAGTVTAVQCQVTDGGAVNFAASLVGITIAAGDQVWINGKFPLGNAS